MINTTATSETVNLDIIGFGPDATDVLLAEDSKPFILSTPDVSFLDKVDTEDGEGEEKSKTPVSIEEGKSVLDNLLVADNTDTEETKQELDTAQKSGRPKTDKSVIGTYLKAKIDKGEFFAFEDYDEKKEKIDEYLGRLPEKELHELLDANIAEKEKAIKANTPKEFYEALPDEAKLVAEYAMKGGEDWKGFFAALSKVEESRSLDPTDNNDQAVIARNYLQATNFGTPEQIEEQIVDWKESDKLGKKAQDFKPKLDQMHKQQVEQELQQQEEWNKQQQAAAASYRSSVQKAIEPGELNGLKLDKKTQTQLFQGLTTANFQSASGQPTNLLGHLLDKIQYTEPNYTLLAEATFLLMDPEGYRNSVKQIGKNEQVEKDVKQLKTAMSKSLGGSSLETETKSMVKKLNKVSNIFSM